MATLRDTFDNIDPLDGWSLPAWTYDLDGRLTGVPDSASLAR